MSRRDKWHIDRFFKRYDSFGRDVPTVNLGGDPEVNTCFGGFLSVVIVTVTLAYAGLKLVELVENTNPIISDVTVPDTFGPSERVRFDDINFKMAFTFEAANPARGYSTLNDPRYLKWVVMDADYDFTAEGGLEN